MGQWLYDPVATALSGEIRFRLPYPQANWREEKRWNEFLVQAMTIARIADRVFQKDAATWEKSEDEFYMWVMQGKKGLEASLLTTSQELF